MLRKFFRDLGLGAKLNIANLLVFAPLLMIAIILTIKGINDLIVTMGQQRAAEEAALVQSRFSEADQALFMGARFLASTPGLIEALADEDITRVRVLLAVGAAPLAFDDIELVNAEGVHIIATGHAANPQEDELIALALLGIEVRGGLVVETEAGQPEFRLVAGIPLRDVTSEILGVLIVSRTVDDAFMTELNFARTENVHLHLIHAGQILAQDQSNVETGALAALLVETSAEYQRALGGQIAVVDRLLSSAANVPYVLAYSPLIAGGETRTVVGVMVQYRDLVIFQRQFLGNMAVALALITIAVVIAIIGINRRYITTPLEGLGSVARQMAGGDYSRRVEVKSGDEIGHLGLTFNEMADRLEETMTGLEQRGRDLAQRSRYLEASAEVAHAAASVLDVDQLMQQVVEVIGQQFELYYVALFIVDESHEWAVQRAGTGETGAARLARGYRLPITGSSSMISWSIVNSQTRIVQGDEWDEVWGVSPELPDVRSEMALPLRSRGRVIGALSLHSDRPNAFRPEVLVVLQTTADQVAVALDNARLLAESQAALEQSRRAYGELSRQAWAQFLRSDQGVGYRYAESAVVPVAGEWRPEMVQAMESGQAVVESRATEAVLAVPLKVRDQVIGVVNLRKTAPGQSWTEEENGLIETLTEQLGLALESARLYQDTQRRAAREQLSAQVTSRMRESLDLETVLKTAVSEMRQALGLEGVIVQLARPETIETTEQ